MNSSVVVYVLLLSLDTTVLLIHCASRATLESQQFQCDSVTLTCITKHSSSFDWYNGSVALIGYAPRQGDTFPLNIYDNNGVSINVTSIDGRSADFNSTSVLVSNASALSMMNIESVQCGDGMHISNPINLTELYVQAPIPEYQCYLALSGSVVASINWSFVFTNDNEVERYRVSVSPDPSSCSSDQVSPSQVYNCSGLDKGTNYTFEVSAFSFCGGQEGERTLLLANPQVPVMVPLVSVKAVYNQDATLTEVIARWNENMAQSHSCYFNQLGYELTLVDSKGETVKNMTVGSNSCTEGVCTATFSSFDVEANENYYVTLTSFNDIGRSIETSTSTNIGASVLNLLNLVFDSSNCSTNVTCISSESNGNCSIEYGEDSSYSNLSLPIQTSLNLPVTLPFMLPSTYYYQIAVNINSSISFQIRRNFTSGEFNARLTTSNQVLLAVGVLAFTLAFAVTVILVVVNVRTKKGSLMFIFLLLAEVAIIIVSVCIWIVVCAIALPQDNTCDTSWQFRRDSAIISVHVMSDLAALVVVIAAIMMYVAPMIPKSNACFKLIGSYRSVNASGGQKSIQSDLQMEMEKYSKEEITEMKNKGKAGRVVEFEKPDLIVNEFADRGEGHDKAVQRTHEKGYREYTEASITKQETTVYEITSHDPKVVKSSKDTHYSHLDRLKAIGKKIIGEGKEEYSVLNMQTQGSKEYSHLSRAQPQTSNTPSNYQTLDNKQQDRSLSFNNGDKGANVLPPSSADIKVNEWSASTSRIHENKKSSSSQINQS